MADSDTPRRTVDLTKSGKGPPPDIVVDTKLTRPSVEERRESARGLIAGGLVFLLVGVVAVSFLLLALKIADMADLDTLLKIIFAPIIGLVGSVIGFYFGVESATRPPSGG